MEIKRATELVLCSLLKEKLSDLNFYPSKGGGDDITSVWQPNHNYKAGDVLRPSNLSLIHAIVVTVGGDSGGIEPAFTDIPGSVITGIPDYLTLVDLATSTPVDTGNPLPPFAAVMCEPSEKTMGQEDTDIMHGSLVWVTKHSQTDVVTHSQNFKRIYDALSNIGSGYDILRRIIIHGVDISGTNDFTDPTKEAHGDVIEFVVGVTAKPL